MPPESDPPPAVGEPAGTAIPRLLEAHGDRLFTLARRFCGNRHEAEDLVQETFLQAWKHWATFRGDSAPETWLYSIAARACQRMHRKRSGEPGHVASLDEFPVDGPVADSTSPVEEAARREMQAAAEAAIQGLPDVFRMPLILKDIVGLSLRQISEITGVPEATVKTRVYRARMSVREAVDAQLPLRDAPPAAFDRQVCLDLLAAKMEALDRNAEFSLPEARFCDRCSAVMASLDLSQEACTAIGHDRLPEGLRKALAEGHAPGRGDHPGPAA